MDIIPQRTQGRVKWIRIKCQLASWDNLKLPAVWFGAKSWFVVRDLLGPSRRQYEFSAPATAHRPLVLPR